VKIIVFGSVKGGVGKTCGVIFTAQALAARGARVIVIDGDPQASSTDYFLRARADDDIASHSLYHALMRRCELTDCLMPTGISGVLIVPSTPDLARADLETVNDRGLVNRFQKSVQGLDADVILMDTPPSISGLELTLAIYAAAIVVVPVQLARWTAVAFRVVSDMVADASQVIGKAPALFALPAIVTEREAQILRKVPDWTPTRTAIFKSAAVRNATNTGNALREGSVAWTCYANLAEELTV
jgi:cellulose biosynthesis protein BcsQ